MDVDIGKVQGYGQMEIVQGAIICPRTKLKHKVYTCM